MTIIFRFTIYILMATLVACGGGGGGGGGGSVTSPGVQSQNANGIWTGMTSVAGSGYSETLAFFNDGEFVAINAYWDEFYQGNYTIMVPPSVQQALRHMLLMDPMKQMEALRAS